MIVISAQLSIILQAETTNFSSEREGEKGILRWRERGGREGHNNESD